MRYNTIVAQKYRTPPKTFIIIMGSHAYLYMHYIAIYEYIYMYIYLQQHWLCSWSTIPICNEHFPLCMHIYTYICVNMHFINIMGSVCDPCFFIYAYILQYMNICIYICSSIDFVVDLYACIMQPSYDRSMHYLYIDK